MTKEEFLIEMTWFLEFYDKKFNDTQTKIWYESLKEMPKDFLNKLFKDFIIHDESPFIPSIGKISNYCIATKHSDLKGKYIP